MSAGRLYATKGGYRLDTDQELIAAGSAARQVQEPRSRILNLEATNQLETTSADMLSELREQLAERNVDL